ncbi:hypothetical protein GCM10029978_111840 [Actinoallomurus acanthiterrae]
MTTTDHSSRVELLLRICENLLSTSGISADDNFYDAGGDSLIALGLIAELSARNLALSLDELLGAATLREAAAAIQDAEPAAEPPAAPAAVLAFTPPQRVLMTLPAGTVRRGADLIEYLKLSVFDVTGRQITPEMATRALRSLAARHDALRTRLVGDRISVDLPLEAFVVGPAVRYDGSTDLNDVITGQLPEYRPADDPLVRIALVEDAVDDRTLLVFAGHHLVCDFTSWRILCGDLDRALDQLGRGEEVRPSSPETTWAQWAHAVEQYERSGRVLAELDYWRSLPVDRVAKAPLDHPLGTNTFESQDGHLSYTNWPTRPAAGRTGPIVLAALADTLARWQGTDTVLVDTRSHGRHVPELGLATSSTVGSFAVAHPLLLRLPGGNDREAIVTSVAEQLRAVPTSGLGFGLLRRPLSGAAEAFDGLPPVEILFDYYRGRYWDSDSHGEVLRPSGFELVRQQQPGGNRPYVLRIHAHFYETTLITHWEYSTNLHDAATIAELATTMADFTTDMVSATTGA